MIVWDREIPNKKVCIFYPAGTTFRFEQNGRSDSRRSHDIGADPRDGHARSAQYTFEHETNDRLRAEADVGRYSSSGGA